MTPDLPPGLLILHGNRFELLREAVFEWLARAPLAPLEEEVFLVQSNGVAEWLKMGLAQHQGVCAATRVELPARFLWRSFRQVLGAAEVPAMSPLDRGALVWRLMALLPEQVGRPGFEPLARFLAPGDMTRRLQLCQRLSELFDQYQVYRGDWLEAWAAGADTLPAPSGAAATPLPADQRWQPLLWRELLAPLGPVERAAVRPELHRRFEAALTSGADPARPVARRVVVFGTSHLPLQTLQALAALAGRAQVLLAVPNPCRYHWADILGPATAPLPPRHRLPSRPGRELSSVAPEDMHAHAHPLLAAWGRQGGDFIRQLDAFDDAAEAQRRFALPRIDLFDDTPGTTLLEQVQARIRDLVPLAEHPVATVPDTDRSIVFHIAHGAQREVEVLHDQLLALLDHPDASDGATPLQPRDIVVMLPDVEAFAPAIRAVFGQYPRQDPRHIPFDIADVSDRAGNPLVLAVDWLLRLPFQRCRLTDVRDLLDVPGIAARFGLSEDDLPRLARWMSEAGVRWGLGEAQREGLGLAACGDQNTWLFGLRRMLLGYASGEPGDADAAFAGIEPYAEVGGLDAALAGSLAALVEHLLHWWQASSKPGTPAQWATAARALLDAFVAPTDESERLTVGALREALQCWLEACDNAGFDEPLPLAVVREAWLSGLEAPGLGRRFLGGGVTFCTLVPMRSIPFEVVCLLGMNDGDFPRAATRSDFDLMALPGQARPGDRSRRDDDRQLMLEALLSARRVLYLSWAGRNARDNSELPPSVLVSQLRDYLAAGWQGEVLAPRTTEHPLQPFSRRYFTEGSGLFTHAREWRDAHLPQPEAATLPDLPEDAEEAAEPDPRVTVARLAAFLKNPVKDFFRHRLDIVFTDGDDVAQDDEAFGLGGLEEHAVVRELLDGFDPLAEADPARAAMSHMQRLQRAGRFSLAALGGRQRDALVDAVTPMLRAWQDLHHGSGAAQPGIGSLQLEHRGQVIDDTVALWPAADPGTPPSWREIVPSRLCDNPRRKSLRGEMLLPAWVRTVAAGACGLPASGVLVGRDASVAIPPMPAERALPLMQSLLDAFGDGENEPLPVACLSALAWVAGGEEAAEKTYEGDDLHARGEGREACLARVFPDFESLAADGRFAPLAQQLYAPLRQWLDEQLQVTLHAAPGDDDGGPDGD
jgi:exodeoxyribonuclease V gamma subunit